MDRGYSTHGRSLMEGSLARDDQAMLTQIKKAYWTTKQQVIKKFGKKQDEHIVASDAELDAKLELYKQIQLSCVDLLKVILLYQKRLMVLAREENSMGKFLKTHGDEDTTQAGKMMRAVGRSQGFSAQQRVQLRQPLYRLFQEVETFRQRAITDTQITVSKMEDARTAYRAALLWMKDVSERLDPDAYNRLEKFRMVQTQVRRTKEEFDRYKLDVMQKVDLLAASRSNMFSHALAAYQNALLTFWKKTSKTMHAVSETFKGFQYYEFNLLKNDLDETTRELARQTASEKAAELVSSLLNDVGHQPKTEEDRLIYDIIMSLQDEKKQDESAAGSNKKGSSAAAENKKVERSKGVQRKESADSTTGLIDFDESDDAFIDDEVTEQFGEFQAAMDRETREHALLGVDKYEPLRMDDDTDLLDDIFGSGDTFGSLDGGANSAELADDLSSLNLIGSAATVAPQLTPASSGFLPSDLLDSGLSNLPSLTGDQRPAPPPYSKSQPAAADNAAATPSKPPAKSFQSSKQPMSSWYNLFADLDPLQDPDAVGKKTVSNDGCA